MKVLLTGATGFIGKRFLYRLLERGVETVCMVRGSSRTDLLERTGTRFVFAPLEDEGSVEKVVTAERPDAVVHCAAKVVGSDEKELYRVNAEGTKNICQACFRNKVERMVYLSSIAVVGGNNDMPLSDNMPYKARNPYGRSKLEAERIVEDYRNKGMRAVVLRPCMVYGEDEPHAMGRILDALAKRRIPFLDVPEMDSKLQLGYVGNIADAMELALYSDECFEGTFILADKEVITLRRFLEILYGELGVPLPFTVPSWAVGAARLIPPVRDIFGRIFRDRTYDISRAEAILGYFPRVSTEEGLKRTVRRWKKKNCVQHGNVLKCAAPDDQPPAEGIEDIFEV
ncbi:MAG: NAD-dependent epimerase/dehydratase family protein [Candidatus Omnitrophica bacterium]|nr:NAD-dependent epimerase/dehydratase family protein [Candidatus Omnitrophota bacterium]